MTKGIEKLEPENNRLRKVECDYDRLQRVLGSERVDELVTLAKAQEIVASRPHTNRDYAR